jgi:RluA family pseudouridine synthase
VTAVQLLVQASGFIAVDKPPGVVVIPARAAGSEISLRQRLEEELKQKLFVVHRLDRDTSGVLLFALNAASHRALSLAFENGEVEKYYLALVRGRVTAPMDIEFPLAPARRGRMRRAKQGESGKAAFTRIRPVEVFELATLVSAQPLTGRTHQIRIHLLEGGHPLLVDPQYGQPSILLGSDLGIPSAGAVLARTPLHAHRLVIPALAEIEPRAIESPLPPDMARAIDALRGESGVHSKGIA